MFTNYYIELVYYYISVTKQLMSDVNDAKKKMESDVNDARWKLTQIEDHFRGELHIFKKEVNDVLIKLETNECHIKGAQKEENYCQLNKLYLMIKEKYYKNELGSKKKELDDIQKVLDKKESELVDKLSNDGFVCELICGKKLLTEDLIINETLTDELENLRYIVYHTTATINHISNMLENHRKSFVILNELEKVSSSKMIKLFEEKIELTRVKTNAIKGEKKAQEELDNAIYEQRKLLEEAQYRLTYG